jgi:MoaA/NifB/PqqE/SkfB family radical SAM enzyme
MKGKPLGFLLVTPLYVALRGLRLMFLSCRTGALAHNFIYYWLFRWFCTESESKKLMHMLQLTLHGNIGVVEWQRRFYTACPQAVRHALKNVFVRRFVLGSMKRRKLAAEGSVVPALVMVSLNTPEAGCNLACSHCYAVGHNNAILPLVLAKKVIQEQEDLGIYNVRLLGGEPFLYKGIWEIFESFPQTSFYVATNATMLTEDVVNRLAGFGNVFPMISLEGFEQTTDAIRGQGVFAKTLLAMKLCKSARLPYSITATVTRSNRQEVTSPAFLQMLDEHRCVGIGFSCYVPIGRTPHPEWQISIQESKELDQVCGLIHNNFGMYPGIGRNGIGRVNDCSAAREYVHILPDGQVESCPFAQWATPELNIKDHTILEVMASPFFAGIRELNSYGIAGAAPCEAPKLASLRTAFTQLGAKPTTQPPTIQIERTRV